MLKPWMTAAPLIWLATGPLALAQPPHPPVHAARSALPPYGKPGECYARTIRPAEYRTETRQVIDRPAWTETRVVPAQTETLVEQVVVTPEVVERVWREPVYREEIQWETVPGPSRRVHEPPRYRRVRETVVLEPGRYVWQKQFDGRTEIYCKVWIPPRQGVVEREVLVSPGRDYEVRDPPLKRKIVVRSLVSEGGWSETRRPAVYRSETRVRVIAPERTTAIQHAAVYRTEATPVLVSPEHEEWVRVTCQHPVPPVRLPPPPPPPPREQGERG